MVTQLWTCTFKYTRGLFKLICKRDREGGERDVKIRETECVWPIKDWYFLFHTDGNRLETVQKYTQPSIWSVCAFSLPQTFWLIKQKPRSKEWCRKTTFTLQSKENSICLIRRIDTNNECAKARLKEKCAKRKTRCLGVCELELLNVCDCMSAPLGICVLPKRS